MSLANLLTEWARLLVQSFVEAGVTDVVVSPGSRSTAFVLAAARHPGLTLHNCIDERAASFFALGQARVTGRPSLLLCTSGTAPAHYYPAVIEATLNRIPLLVLSADRPLELVDCAAPQTIDQVKLFGDHVRKYVDLGVADPSPRFLRGSRRAVAQAVFATRWPEPGAVHLNVRARKPFEPREASTDEERALSALVASILAHPAPRIAAPRALPDLEAVAGIAAAVGGSARGLVVCGPGPLAQHASREAVQELCRRTGWPLLAEAASQLKFVAAGPIVTVDAFGTLLGSPSFRRDHPPEMVIQIGAPPVSAAWEHYLDAHPGCRRVVVAEGGWNDWLATATDLLFCDLTAGITALADAIDAPPLDGERLAWQRAWVEGNTRAWQATQEVLSQASGPGSPLNEGAVVRRLVERLPDDALLMVGNSLSIRLVDCYAPAGVRPVAVLSQRGANGIDGLIAGAAGSAAASGRPLVLLLGDVSALHDLNGLLLAREVRTPLVVVILQNGGGRIFELLPVARDPAVSPEVVRHLTTPHTIGFGDAASLYGVRYARVEDLPGFEAALSAAAAADGCTLVEVIVEAHGAARMLAAIRQRLEASEPGGPGST